MKIKCNRKSFFWMAICITYALPIISGNFFDDLIVVLHLGGGTINIIEIAVVLFFTFTILHNKKSHKKTNAVEDYLFLIICMLIIVYAYVGGSRGYNYFADLKFLLVPVLLFWSIRHNNENITIQSFIKKVSNYILIGLSIAFIVYFTRNSSIWGITSVNGGVFLGNYFGFTVFIVPLCVYDLLTKRIGIKIWKSVYIVCGSVFFAFGNGSRALFLLISVECIAVILINMSVNKGWNIERRKLVLLLLFSIAFFGLLIFMFKTNSEIVVKLLNTNFSEGDSLGTRVYTWNYQIEQIKHNIWGEGLGYKLFGVNRYKNVAADANLYVDFYILTIARKMGCIGALLFSALMICPVFSFLYMNKHEKSQLYIIMCMTYLSTLIFGTVVSSQLYHARIIYTFVWSIIAISANEKYKTIKGI